MTGEDVFFAVAVTIGAVAVGVSLVAALRKERQISGRRKQMEDEHHALHLRSVEAFERIAKALEEKQ